MSMYRKILRTMERAEITTKNKAKKKAFKHRFDKKKTEEK
jgi:hypothetical protein